MPYTFLDFAEQVLDGDSKPATYQEIWATGKEKGLTENLPQRGRTPWQTLASRLFVDVRDNPQSRFIRVGSNPARFFLAARRHELTRDDLREPANAQVPSSREDNRFTFHERKLHPLLAYYAFTNLSFNRGRQVYTKTILHERSRHTALNEWVHP